MRRKVSPSEKMSDQFDEKVLNWLTHVVRMNEERITKIVYEFNMEGIRDKVMPFLEV